MLPDNQGYLKLAHESWRYRAGEVAMSRKEAGLARFRTYIRDFPNKHEAVGQTYRDKPQVSEGGEVMLDLLPGFPQPGTARTRARVSSKASCGWSKVCYGTVRQGIEAADIKPDYRVQT
jgi:hypothetical protein